MKESTELQLRRLRKEMHTSLALVEKDVTLDECNRKELRKEITSMIRTSILWILLFNNSE